MTRNISGRAWPLLIAFAFLTGSCVKSKFDNKLPLTNVGNLSASAIRLFNFYGNVDVIVNNIPLTAFTGGGANTGSTAVGAALFPSGIWATNDGASPFVLPNSLLDKAGNAHVTLLGRGTALSFPNTVDTIITNDVAHPKDYYMLPTGVLKVVNRENLPPADARSFKIRVVNAGTKTDTMGLALHGPMTLTWSDGSQVSPALTNILPGQTSDYIEIPYGAYQFKVFLGGSTIDVTRQLAEVPVVAYFDACQAPGPFPQEGLSPRVRTFKPGGVYSIVVTANKQDLFSDCTRYSNGLFMNSYRIITEYDPGINNVFARMQAVNALPDQTVTVKVDGQPLAGQAQLGYIGAAPSIPAVQSPYDIYVKGNHHVEAQDAQGKTIASGDIELYPYDNYTIWVWPGADNKPALVFEPNDMTGTLYTTTYHPGTSGTVIPDDGTDGLNRRTRYPYALQARFLNLSPDLPYVTFTNDGQLFLPVISLNFYLDTVRHLSAYTNLAPGMLPERNGSIIYSLVPFSPSQGNTLPAGGTEAGRLPRFIRAYQSTPGPSPALPGTLLSDIDPVDVLQTFVSNPGLYTDPRFMQAETGVYSVALVGKTAGTTSADKARIVVIKHNK